MADIQTLLKKIKTAIYGKDVRDSIHDAISQCYKDGKAGAFDLEARELIDSLEGQVNNLVKPANPQKNELTNIRTGAWGEQYSTAGDAVRTQIRDTHSIHVGHSRPTKLNTHLWLNPDAEEEFTVPEIIDNPIVSVSTNDEGEKKVTAIMVSSGDTWSSERISDNISTSAIKWNIDNYVNHLGVLGGSDKSGYRMYSDLIPCLEGTEITVLAETNHDKVSGLSFYDANKKWFKGITNADTGQVIGVPPEKITVQAPVGTRFIRLSTTVTYGWSLEFSEPPLFKYIDEYAVNFDSKVKHQMVYNALNTGMERPIYSVTSSKATINDDGSITMAAKTSTDDGGFYFIYFDHNAFVGDICVKVKQNRDARIQVCFATGSNNPDHTYGPKFTSINRNGYEIVYVDKNTFPIWSQPTGANDAYGMYDVVNYNGKLYRSAVNNNTYTPGSNPDKWLYYSYAVIRIDNRYESEPLTIYEYEMIDTGISKINRPFYISTSGSDDNDGTSDKPLATVNKALKMGASDIRIFPGTYNQTIDVGLSGRSELNISACPDNAGNSTVKFSNPITLVSSNDKNTSDGLIFTVQIPDEYNINSILGDNTVWLFGQDPINGDWSTLINDSERHPLQRGETVRCRTPRIYKCEADNLNEALDEIAANARPTGDPELSVYKWYFDSETKILYYSAPHSKLSYSWSTNIDYVSNAVYAALFQNKLFKNPNPGMIINVSGIETEYTEFNVGGFAKAKVTDCKSSCVFGSGAFTYDNTPSCEFIRCEAAMCFNGYNGDGFNAHTSNKKHTTATFIDCWSHDNNDDGFSDHERCESTIIGGLYEYNGKGGIVPSYGAHCTCYNVYSRNNYAGFYCTGPATTAEGGKYTQMYCSNCIAEANNRGGTKTGFRVDGNGNTMMLVDCIAIDNETGFATGTSNNYGRLINCKASGSGVTVDGNFDILRPLTIASEEEPTSTEGKLDYETALYNLPSVNGNPLIGNFDEQDPTVSVISVSDIDTMWNGG